MEIADCKFCGSKGEILTVIDCILGDGRSRPHTVRCGNYRVSRIHFLGSWHRATKDAVDKWNEINEIS